MKLELIGKRIYNNKSDNVTRYNPPFGYYTIDSSITKSKIDPYSYALYTIFVMLAGDHSNIVHTTIKELAELYGRSTTTTRRWLNVLIEKGIIEKIDTDTYILHDSIRDSLEG